MLIVFEVMLLIIVKMEILLFMLIRNKLVVFFYKWMCFISLKVEERI